MHTHALRSASPRAKRWRNSSTCQREEKKRREAKVNIRIYVKRDKINIPSSLLNAPAALHSLVRDSHVIYILWNEKEFIYITLRYCCQQFALKTVFMHCIASYSRGWARTWAAAASSTLCKFICRRSFRLIRRNSRNAGDGLEHHWNRKWRIRIERKQNSTAPDFIRPNAFSREVI